MSPAALARLAKEADTAIRHRGSISLYLGALRLFERDELDRWEQATARRPT